jgi:hypothetical protein
LNRVDLPTFGRPTMATVSIVSPHPCRLRDYHFEP